MSVALKEIKKNMMMHREGSVVLSYKREIGRLISSILNRKHDIEFL